MPRDRETIENVAGEVNWRASDMPAIEAELSGAQISGTERRKRIGLKKLTAFGCAVVALFFAGELAKQHDQIKQLQSRMQALQNSKDTDIQERLMTYDVARREAEWYTEQLQAAKGTNKRIPAQLLNGKLVSNMSTTAGPGDYVPVCLNAFVLHRTDESLKGAWVGVQTVDDHTHQVVVRALPADGFHFEPSPGGGEQIINAMTYIADVSSGPKQGSDRIYGNDLSTVNSIMTPNGRLLMPGLVSYQQRIEN